MRLLIWTVCLLFPALINAQDKTLYLNPDNASGAKASTLFSEAALIQLQTNKASYFNNIADFLVTPFHFIFLDNASNCIFIFNKEGRFLHKYKKKKYSIQSIQYVNSKNALFIVSRNKNYTIPPAKAQQMIQKPELRDFSKYVNLELLYLNTPAAYKIEKLPVPPYALNSIYYFNGNYLTQSNRYNKYLNDTIAYHLNIVAGNNITQSYFPFLNIPKLPPYYEDIGFAIDNTLTDTAFLIQKEFDNTIYKLTPDSLYVQYKFVFPAAQSMPADFQSTIFKNNIEFTDYKNNHGKALTGFYNMLEHNNLVFFSASDNSYGRKNFIFNKTSNLLYDLAKVPTDSSIYFLPTKIFTTISEQDEDYVYTRISSSDLLKEKSNILSKSNNLPASVKSILDGLDKFNNPVIIKLKTKAVITQ